MERGIHSSSVDTPTGAITTGQTHLRYPWGNRYLAMGTGPAVVLGVYLIGVPFRGLDAGILFALGEGRWNDTNGIVRAT